MAKVKVISLIQPWASLVVMGAKKNETRSFQIKYRGELYIHASQGFPRWARNISSYPPFTNYIQSHQDLPTGQIIGKVNLFDIKPTEIIKSTLSEEERAFGDYGNSRFAWLLNNALMFEKPIPAKGSLGIWEFELKEEEVLHG